MKIIISPAKKMTTAVDTVAATRPLLLDRAKTLYAWLKGRSPAALQKLWQCSDTIAALNIERLKNTALEDLDTAPTPALLAYQGIQYQAMAPLVFTEHAEAYLAEHLRILSALYGVLAPTDGVVPYRLEMAQKAAVASHRNLYAFWGDALYHSLMDKDRTIVNLASKEYAKAVIPYLMPGDRFVTCLFADLVDGKPRQKATYAKMARGEMVRFMAENAVTDLEALKAFDGIHYFYDAGRSNGDTFVFIRRP